MGRRAAAAIPDHLADDLAGQAGPPSIRLTLLERVVQRRFDRRIAATEALVHEPDCSNRRR